MHDAVTCNIAAKYNTVHYEYKFDPKVAGSVPLCATIFLQTKFDCLHKSLQLKTHNQNDWSAKIQIEYTGLRRVLHLDFFSKLDISPRLSFEVLISFCHTLFIMF